jgi:hypothetical protein
MACPVALPDCLAWFLDIVGIHRPFELSPFDQPADRARGRPPGIVEIA